MRDLRQEKGTDKLQNNKITGDLEQETEISTRVGTKQGDKKEENSRQEDIKNLTNVQSFAGYYFL